ncbi:hypothetical protein ACHAWF_007988 [Thalassiosira exigua]
MLHLWVALLLAVQNVAAFTSVRTGECRTRPSALHMQLQKAQDRRSFLVRQILSPAVASVATAVAPHPALAEASLVDKSSPDVPAFGGGVSEGKRRFQLAIKDIDDLLANYEVITKSGGDNVRLYLGTQGLKSHMCGISKVLKSLKEEAEDIVEYTEALNEFEAYFFQAEGAAYQSLFVEHSSAKSTPESLLKTAKGDIVNMRKFMGDLAIQLNLDA